MPQDKADAISKVVTETNWLKKPLQCPTAKRVKL